MTVNSSLDAPGVRHAWARLELPYAILKMSDTW